MLCKRPTAERGGLGGLHNQLVRLYMWRLVGVPLQTQVYLAVHDVDDGLAFWQSHAEGLQVGEKLLALVGLGGGDRRVFGGCRAASEEKTVDGFCYSHIPLFFMVLFTLQR